MFATLDECLDAWESSGRHGSIAERIERNSKWMQYYHYIAANYKGNEKQLDSHTEDLVQFLLNERLLAKTSTVLDIGAGMGDYTLAFAKNCRRINALEMEKSSLSVLKNRATDLWLSNIDYTNSMWEDFNDEKQYSFVFSSMCPAICNFDELLRMESLSDKACGLVAVSRGSVDLHRKKLMSQLSISPVGGMTTESIWYYETLYLMDRYPCVKNYSFSYQKDVPIDEICSSMEAYFKIFDVPQERCRPIIRKYFEGVAENGIVHDETIINKALIYWEVPQD